MTQTEPLAWDAGGEERLSGAFVSANWFDELGAAPVRGRLFHEHIDAAPEAPGVVVLSYAYWQRQFGGRDLVGTIVRVNRRPAVVIGIVERQFPPAGFQDRHVWLPIEQYQYFQHGGALSVRNETSSIEMYGRLRGDVPASAVDEDLAAVLEAWSAGQVRRGANEPPAGRNDEIRPDERLEFTSAAHRFASVGEQRQINQIIAAIALLTLLVLMVACLNLSSLTLARAVTRVREMSIRNALGAPRWRVIRHLGIEAGILASAGALGGLFVAWAATTLLASSIDLSPSISLAPDWRMFVAATGAAIVAATATGVLPMWRLGRRDLALATKDGGERVSGGLYAARLRHTIVACQIAGSCVLLVFAVLVVRGLQRVSDAARGLDFQHTAVLEPSLSSFGVRNEADVRAYWEGVRAILARHPEVDRMTLVSRGLLTGGTAWSDVQEAPRFAYHALNVDPDYFATMGIPFVSGRTFAPDDGEVLILSRRGAMAMYGSLDVIGAGFPRGTTDSRIVGIVEDAPGSDLEMKNSAEEYGRIRPGQATVLIVRAKTDPVLLLPVLRQASQGANERVVPDVRLLRDDFRKVLRTPRLLSAVAAAAAFVALALACVGVFGVVTYAVGLRTREVGIRMALGATSNTILGSLVARTLWSAAVGMAAGQTGGWLGDTRCPPNRSSFEPFDLTAYGGAGVVLLATITTAALLPALRTLRQDPLRALRHE